MADLNLLYTVTCRREPFYAVVEPGSGRVWTAPTKDGAMRQARDAGITEFTERTITRENFLRSLGITDEPPVRARSEPESHQQPAPAPDPSSPGSWFVAGAGGLDADSFSQDFSMPRSFRSGKKSGKSPKGSPFGAGAIAPPTRPFEIAMDDEDILIVPSSQREGPKATPFTDAPPPKPDEAE